MGTFIDPRTTADPLTTVHPVPQVFKHAILQLVEKPPARRSHPWPKVSLAEMTKLDAFLKESQRFNGSDPCAMLRKSRAGVRLRDDTRIPAGTLTGTSQRTVHHDERHYQAQGS
ncbi:hypothetical protein LXA43DRAFT_1133358 [Ganoderma leucocontextum]|nr:hypothetical protein LXA43DRAFT_1133358 [Ganoderma leucocontextum]